jgi:DNA-binding NarL/FixJ family response regulator
MQKIRILLVDDDPNIRYTLRRMITSSNPLHEIVGEAENGKQAVQMALSLKPDIILMDADMPVMNGVEATRQIFAKMPRIKILAMSNHDESGWINAMLSAGAQGFLSKMGDANRIQDAIQSLVCGDSYLSPRPAWVALQRRFSSGMDSEGKQLWLRLSPRERQVLGLVAQGRLAKEIAEILHLSEHTIHNHCQSIMDTLDVHSMSALVLYAVKEGLAVGTVDNQHLPSSWKA